MRDGISLFRKLPQTVQSLCVSLPCKIRQIANSLDISLFRKLLQIAQRPVVSLSRKLPQLHNTFIRLLGVPFHGFLEILFDPVTILITLPQVVLRDGISLFRKLPQTVQSLCVSLPCKIRQTANSLGVSLFRILPQLIKSLCISLVRGLGIPRHGFLQVLFDACPVGMAIAQPGLRLGISLVRGLGIPRHGFLQVLFDACPVGIAIAQPALRRGNIPVCGFGIPIYGFLEVFLDACPVGIAIAQPDTCLNVVRVCGLGVPVHGFLEVLFDAGSIFIAGSEFACCPGIPLQCGFDVPFRGLRKVLFEACPVGIAISQLVLRRRIALLRGQAVPFCRLREVFTDADPVIIAVSEAGLRIGIPFFRRHAVVFYRRLNVLLDAVAVVVTFAEIVERFRVPLIRRLTVPLHGFLDVPFESGGTLGIEFPEFVLRFGVAAFRRRNDLRRIRSGILCVQMRDCGACGKQQGEQNRMMLHGNLCQFVFGGSFGRCVVLIQIVFYLKTERKGFRLFRQASWGGDFASIFRCWSDPDVFRERGRHFDRFAAGGDADGGTVKREAFDGCGVAGLDLRNGIRREVASELFHCGACAGFAVGKDLEFGHGKRLGQVGLQGAGVVALGDGFRKQDEPADGVAVDEVFQAACRFRGFFQRQSEDFGEELLQHAVMVDHVLGDLAAFVRKLDRVVRIVVDAPHFFKLAERAGHGRHLHVELGGDFLGMGVPLDRDQFRDRFKVVFQTFRQLFRHGIRAPICFS